MSQESKTPRTDVHVEEVFNCDDELVRVVNVNFARQLERELAAVTEERDAFIASARIREANSGWRPIETAPKDGTRILLTNGRDVDSAYWSDCAEHGCFVNGPGWQIFSCEDSWYSIVFDAPTRWMPMPAPPTTEPEQ